MHSLQFVRHNTQKPPPPFLQLHACLQSGQHNTTSTGYFQHIPLLYVIYTYAMQVYNITFPVTGTELSQNNSVYTHMHEPQIVILFYVP